MYYENKTEKNEKEWHKRKGRIRWEGRAEGGGKRGRKRSKKGEEEMNTYEEEEVVADKEKEEEEGEMKLHERLRQRAAKATNLDSQPVTQLASEPAKPT